MNVISRTAVRGLLLSLVFAFALPRPAEAVGHYALAFWREMGRTEAAGGSIIQLRVWTENGAPLAGAQVYTSWGVLQATTDIDGRAEIAMDTDADRDVQIRDRFGSTTDTSPLFSSARYPDYDQHSYVVGFVFKSDAGNPGIFDTGTCGTLGGRGSTNDDAPYTRSLIYNSINCDDRGSDAFQINTWSSSFGQTFTVPANVNRILGVSLAIATGDPQVTWTVSVHEGTPQGPQVFSKNTPHPVHPFRWLVYFGVNDCPVTPGQTYAIKVTRSGGLNTFTMGDVHNGNFYWGTASVPDRDIMGFIVGANAGTPPTATPTATATRTPTATRTSTPTSTPTATAPDLDRDGVPDAQEHRVPAAGQTNQLLPDSDGDGLPDGQEDTNASGSWDLWETKARERDTDGDGAWDGVETNLLSTDPLSAHSPASFVDADGDGLPTPLDFNEADPDSDNDRFTDGYEAVTVGLGAAFEASIKPPLGDLNLDGAVSNVDALVTQSLFLGVIQPSDPVFQGTGFGHADPNRDGQISNVDALILQSIFLSTIPSLPL